MKVYKLTRANGTTHGGYQWSLPNGKRPGKWHIATGEDTGTLCSDGYLHWYHHPMLAALLHPQHVDFGPDMVLWEAEARGNVLNDNGMKGGSRELRLTKRMDMPVFSTEQRVAFALYVAQEVYKDEAFAKWACAWLDGSDRSEAAAGAAWAAAGAAGAEDAAWAAARAAAGAAEAAARAARAAARAARAAAWAAAGAAEAAARAAAWAAEADRADRAAAGAAAAAAGIGLEMLVKCAEKAHNFRL